MSGQIQLEKYNKNALLSKYNDKLINQVSLLFIKDKFKIKTDFDKNIALHAYLVKNLFEDDICETIEYFNNELQQKN